MIQTLDEYLEIGGCEDDLISIADAAYEAVSSKAAIRRACEDDKITLVECGGKSLWISPEDLDAFREGLATAVEQEVEESARKCGEEIDEFEPWHPYKKMAKGKRTKQEQADKDKYELWLKQIDEGSVPAPALTDFYVKETLEEHMKGMFFFNRGDPTHILVHPDREVQYTGKLKIIRDPDCRRGWHHFRKI